MKCVNGLVLVALLAVPASAEVRLIDQAKEDEYRSIMPTIADSALQARFENRAQTFAFESRRFWKGSYSYNYTFYGPGLTGRGRIRNGRTVLLTRETFNRLGPGGLDIEDEWKHPSGEAPGPGEGEVKFISLPMKDGKVQPIASEGYSIRFPVGTVFMGCKYRTKNGKKVAQELRIRRKGPKKWSEEVYALNKSQFVRDAKADVGSCMQCHKDAGTFVNSKFGWSGSIGNDTVFSFGNYAAGIDNQDAFLNTTLIDNGLMVEYDEEKHAKSHPLFKVQ